jgi:hypothetical protein
MQFSVFVAVLIALLLSGMILYAYTFLYMKEQSKGAITNIQMADLGIHSLLQQTVMNSDTTHLAFATKHNQTIKTNLSQWGVFHKGTCIAQFRTKIFTKTALIGSSILSPTAPTLYLQDTYNGLSVVGNTIIKGNVYLPQQGIKSGYIAGNSYYGSQLLYGTAGNSTKKLPELQGNLLKGIIFYLKDYMPDPTDSSISMVMGKKTTNSFKKKTLEYYSLSPIILEHSRMSGNIIIKSETSIKIKKTAELHDVILIAPVIEIESETIGNFQALASAKITVGNNCRLNYPSALLLYQDNLHNTTAINTDPFDNQIFINNGTTVKGIVCYLQTNEIPDFKTQIVLETEALIKGQVYCNGNFEIKGTVSGSVYTRQFVANESGSIFVNHIYNATIENENIPTLYGGIVFDGTPKTVVKWLY